MDNQASKYIINQKYSFDFEKNIFIDFEAINEIRLEPRISKLLLLFIDNNKSLLKREYITSNIWNNYGGADEGLTQAISFLRKILSDRGKSIIQTIPKKGYIFNAHITKEEVLKKYEKLKIQELKIIKKQTKIQIAFALFAFFIIVLLSVLFFHKNNDTIKVGAETENASKSDSSDRSEQPKSENKDLNPNAEK